MSRPSPGSIQDLWNLAAFYVVERMRKYHRYIGDDIGVSASELEDGNHLDPPLKYSHIPPLNTSSSSSWGMRRMWWISCVHCGICHNHHTHWLCKQRQICLERSVLDSNSWSQGLQNRTEDFLTPSEYLGLFLCTWALKYIYGPCYSEVGGVLSVEYYTQCIISTTV